MEILIPGVINRDPSVLIPVRFAYEVRWTGVLQSTLGDKYMVIEEGLNSRNHRNR